VLLPCSSAGRKQLSRALELFLQGLTAPTMVCSAITAATYKKYSLVSLIHTGAPTNTDFHRLAAQYCLVSSLQQLEVTLS
jgi:hypothetical protein